ncbi:hypothetical protein U1Q18_010522 [Sarracenia purpurea var. burkii]
MKRQIENMDLMMQSMIANQAPSLVSPQQHGNHTHVTEIESQAPIPTMCDALIYPHAMMNSRDGFVVPPAPLPFPSQ